MAWYVVLVIAVTFLATSEAVKHANEVKAYKLVSQSASPSNRLLRTTSISDKDEEERGAVKAKMLTKLSRLAEKRNMPTLSKNLEHKAWLAAGESPTSLFRKYKWYGKTNEQLKQDPNYPRYEGFDDVWMKAQHKKGTIYTTDVWIKLMAKKEAT